MFKFRLGLLVAIALPFVPMIACNGGSQSATSSGPTDPTPILSCGLVRCPDPLPTVGPCTGGVADARGICSPWPTPQPTLCPETAGGCGPLPRPTFLPEPLPIETPLAGTSTGIASSLGQGTKDTGLEQAEFQRNLMNAQAQNLVNRFAMSVPAATQLAQLANRIQAMAALGNGVLTDADRAAVTQSALGIAGVTSEQVNAAISQSQSGDNTATEALLETAARNLGMPSSATLRDQLLPALGISLN